MNELNNMMMKNENLSTSLMNVEEARAVQEIQAQVVIAKKFPRNKLQCLTNIKEVCKSKKVADEAFYAFPRGKSIVRGLSIRCAEILTQYWGNIRYGIDEIFRGEGFSECKAYAWDLETNNYTEKKFHVKHIRYSKEKGNQLLTEERDVYELIANNGSRRLRSCLLQIIPRDIIDEATEELELTMSGKQQTEPIVEVIKRMLAKFLEIGVTQEMIEKKFEKTADKLIKPDLIDLKSIYKSITENIATIEEFFNIKEENKSSLNEELLNKGKMSPNTPESPQDDKIDNVKPEPVEAGDEPEGPPNNDSYDAPGVDSIGSLYNDLVFGYLVHLPVEYRTGTSVEIKDQKYYRSNFRSKGAKNKNEIVIGYEKLSYIPYYLNPEKTEIYKRVPGTPDFYSLEQAIEYLRGMKDLYEVFRGWEKE